MGIHPVLATVAVGKDEIGVLEGARLVDIGDYQGSNMGQRNLVKSRANAAGGLTAPNVGVNRVIGNPFSGFRLGPRRRRGESTCGNQSESDDCGEVHFQ